MRNRLRLLGFAAFLLAGCGDSTLPARDFRQLDDYRFNFQQTCFCLRDQTRPVTIEVRDGEVVRVVSREDGTNLTARGTWPTLRELNDRIEEARRSGTEVRAEFDPWLRYPTRVVIGTLADDGGVAYAASDLKAL